MEGNEPKAINTPQSEVTPGVENNQNPTQELKLSGWTAGATAEQKEKYGSTLAKYEKLPSFLDAAFTAMDKVSRAIVKPGEEASDEEISAYREAMGIPADPSGYELNAEGTGIEHFIEGLRKMAHEKGYSQEQAAMALDFYVQAEKDATERLNTEIANTQKKAVEELRKEFGSAYEGKMTKAKRLVAGYFGKEYADLLDESLVGNDARFIRGMMNLAELVSEDSLDNPVNPGGKPKNSVDYPFPNTPDM